MANIIRITRFYGKDGLMNDKYCVDYDEPVTRNYKTWKTFTIKGEMRKKHFNFIMNATSRTEYKNGVKYREVYEQTASEEPTEPTEEPTATSNYDGVAYPEKEDCKTCISRSDCKYKLTLQFNEKCEMKQPVEMYVDTEIPLLLNIKSTLETIFDRIKSPKIHTLKEYFSVSIQSFTVFGDVYAIKINVGYTDSIEYEQICCTKNKKRVSIRTLKNLYKKICSYIERV